MRDSVWWMFHLHRQFAQKIRIVYVKSASFDGKLNVRFITEGPNFKLMQLLHVPQHRMCIHDNHRLPALETNEYTKNHILFGYFEVCHNHIFLNRMMNTSHH